MISFGFDAILKWILILIIKDGKIKAEPILTSSATLKIYFACYDTDRQVYEGYVLKPSALRWLIYFLCYRSIQVPQRQKRRMTQMAAMRSGGRLAVSTMP